MQNIESKVNLFIKIYLKKHTKFSNGLSMYCTQFKKEDKIISPKYLANNLNCSCVTTW